MLLIDRDDKFINNMLLELDNNETKDRIFVNTKISDITYSNIIYYKDILEVQPYNKDDIIIYIGSGSPSKVPLSILKYLNRNDYSNIIVFDYINTYSLDTIEEYFSDVGEVKT